MAQTTDVTLPGLARVWARGFTKDEMGVAWAALTDRQRRALERWRELGAEPLRELRHAFREALLAASTTRRLDEAAEAQDVADILEAEKRREQFEAKLAREASRLAVQIGRHEIKSHLGAPQATWWAAADAVALAAKSGLSVTVEDANVAGRHLNWAFDPKSEVFRQNLVNELEVARAQRFAREDDEREAEGRPTVHSRPVDLGGGL